MRGRVVRVPVLRDRRVDERPSWDAERVQAALNVAGGVAFAAGSLLFLDSSLMRPGIYLFVLGSFAMAAGAIGVWRQRHLRAS